MQRDSGQDGGDGFAGGEERKLAGRAGLQVIDTERAQFDREFQASDAMELLGVKLDRQTVLPRCVEDEARFFGLPGFSFDEDIDRLGQLSCCYFGD